MSQAQPQNCLYQTGDFTPDSWKQKVRPQTPVQLPQQILQQVEQGQQVLIPIDQENRISYQQITDAVQDAIHMYQLNGSCEAECGDPNGTSDLVKKMSNLINFSSRWRPCVREEEREYKVPKIRKYRKEKRDISECSDSFVDSVESSDFSFSDLDLKSFAHEKLKIRKSPKVKYERSDSFLSDSSSSSSNSDSDLSFSSSFNTGTTTGTDRTDTTTDDSSIESDLLKKKAKEILRAREKKLSMHDVHKAARRY